MRISTLNVQRTPIGCEAKDQATWTVFVRGIIFDDFAVLYGLFDLSGRNPAPDTLVQRMERILALGTPEEFTDQLDHSATGAIMTPTQFFRNRGLLNRKGSPIASQVKFRSQVGASTGIGGLEACKGKCAAAGDLIAESIKKILEWAEE